MNARLRVFLACVAIALFVLAVINFSLVVARREVLLPIYVSHPLGGLAAVFLLFGVARPALIARAGSAEPSDGPEQRREG